MAEANRRTAAHNFQDLTGDTYNSLRVESFAGRNRRGQSRWNCRCLESGCGRLVVLLGYNVLNGHTKTCGCTKPARCAAPNVTHGCAGHKINLRTPEYTVWYNMRSRCAKPKNTAYRHYGARGIRVCERWLDFANFIADMGPRPSPEHSIDRMDNDGPYSPSNCRWATKVEQLNNRSDNHRLTWGGKTRTIAEWSRIVGIRWQTLWARVARYGWSAERALTSPVR